MWTPSTFSGGYEGFLGRQCANDLGRVPALGLGGGDDVGHRPADVRQLQRLHCCSPARLGEVGASCKDWWSKIGRRSAPANRAAIAAVPSARSTAPWPRSFASATASAIVEAIPRTPSAAASSSQDAALGPIAKYASSAAFVGFGVTQSVSDL